MIILHGSWLSHNGDSAACFVVWGEVALTDPPPKPRGRPRTSASGAAIRRHPFSAPAAALRQSLPASGMCDAAIETSVLAHLPSLAGEPMPSRSFIRERNATGQPTLATWSLLGLAFEPTDTLGLLTGLPTDDDTTPGIELGADLRFWQEAARFALHLLAGQRFTPQIIEADGQLLARWQPILDAPEDQSIYEQFARTMPPICRALTRADRDQPPGPRALLTDFLDTLIDAFARHAAEFRRPRSARQGSPAYSWLAALASDDPGLNVPETFLKQYRAWAHSAQAASDGSFRICFRLDPPDQPDDDEIILPAATARDWLLRYFLQANDDPSLLVPVETVWRERGSMLTFLNRTFDQPQERLLAGLGLAARMFPPIEHSLRSARPDACPLTADEALTFLREAALLLQASSFGVLLPDLSTGLGVRVKLAPKHKTKAPTGGVARLSFDSIIKFDWELALGDQPLSRAEFDKLAALKVPLVRIRGRWVELHPEQLQQALAFWQRTESGQLSLAEALRMVLAPDALAGMPVTDVATAGWFGDLIREMNDGARMTPLPSPPGFVGTLRHYQQTGFAWLAFLRRYGLGACLADDMGLGKTIQTIALLLHQRSAGANKPSLLICPTSVVGNWLREVARFAPSLRVMVHHGAEREKAGFAELVGQYDLVISSYALLHRDEQQLSEIEWEDVILDEAQNIKNPDTRQAQTARKLHAANRIALTGTPVENRLSELWSIFQFLNPGFLGSRSDFQAQFARPIERTQDPEAAQRLKALVGPFILRRVKTDPTVIDDLPAKNEMKVFCSLTKEQVTLYEAVVRDSLRRIEESDGMERRGLVLATLLKLKQVCNHPAQLLKDSSALAERSGKLARLVEQLEEVRAVKERTLIFTQFSEMGHMIKAQLQSVCNDEVLFLYGGTPVKAREAMIRRFQDDPHGPFAFVLSIKAGGTGLNLTRANHVFHFDRWWNPAVENQATDRAFRIGQKRNVQVYKYICAGTLEERIDEMIERKQVLAERIVGSSEAWVTELSTEQLRDLFVLRKEALA